MSRWRGRDITSLAAHEVSGRRHRLHLPAGHGFSRVCSVRENVQIACEHARRTPAAPYLRGRRPLPCSTSSASPPLPTNEAGHSALRQPTSSRYRPGCLPQDPPLILLDEPAAGLNDSRNGNASSVSCKQFPGYGISVCVIDHDMKLMQMLCKRLVVLDFGSKIADGPTQAVLTDPKVLEVYLGGALRVCSRFRT